MKKWYVPVCLNGFWSTGTDWKNGIALLLLGWMVPATPGSAQSLLFDFDNAPLMTSLPVSQTVGSMTAVFSATGQGYSIQNANTIGFTPPGFAGRIIYPNSIFLADLLVDFNQPVTDFSIMYACQELGCDDAATMRVTAFMNGTWVGTNTRTATIPGTWPVDTLSCSFAQGFDSVVVHYDSPPPTCQDYGVIYMADNMLVTPFNTSLHASPAWGELAISPNPVASTATLSFSLSRTETLRVALVDVSGRLVWVMEDQTYVAGDHRLVFDLNEHPVDNGIYFLKLHGCNFERTVKVVVQR